MQAINARPTMLTQRVALGGSSLPVRAVARTTPKAFRLSVEAAKEFEIAVEKPLGVKIGARGGREGGVIVKGVTGNAAKAGLKNGDQIIYHSSFFGDELWPADSVGFCNTAINACPNVVDFVVVRGADIGTVNVKRLNKRPIPPKFGRRLSEAQKERATHICIDCGFIYYLPTAFAEQPRDYVCPQCQAPKSRFAGYDAYTGKTIGNTGLPLSVTISLVLGLVLAGAFVFVGLN